MPHYLAYLEGRKLSDLYSFIDLRSSPPALRNVSGIKEHRAICFLDSGAYSAWSRGLSITVEEYAKFILEHRDLFQIVAGLDVIPGSKTDKNTSSGQIALAAEQTWENYLQLKELLKPAGIEPIATFHYGEPFKYLERMLAAKVGYLGLGGVAKRGMTERLPWLDKVWSEFLTDREGWPIVKAHGFGMTSLELILRYPWASIDSTSWVLSGRFGMVFMLINGTIHKITFSNQSPKMREEGQHFHSFSKREQGVIAEHLGEIGLSPEKLIKDYVARDLANIRFFLDLEESWDPKPFKRAVRQEGFF